MSFNDSSDKGFNFVLGCGLLLAVLAYSCAKKDEDAPKTCETVCREQGGYYTGYDFNWLVVQCYCKAAK